MNDAQRPPDDDEDREVVRLLRGLGGIEAPEGFERRVMARVPSHAPRRPFWMVLQPAWAIAFGVVLLGLGFWAGRSSAPRAGVPTRRGESPPQIVALAEPVAVEGDADREVRFMLARTGAQHVEIAGDFNDWGSRPARLRDDDGDGVWTGSLPLAPGSYRYMYIVDGSWVTDPSADQYRDDGFGNRNAVLRVN